MGLVNDCEALLDSEDALGGSLNWDHTDTPMSDWDGVTMSGDRVTAVNLRDQGLDGTIPAALGRLSDADQPEPAEQRGPVGRDPWFPERPVGPDGTEPAQQFNTDGRDTRPERHEPRRAVPAW